ncbi:MAG: 50S ribosomal protein L9 [Candidatus Omnitrophota bacterium]
MKVILSQDINGLGRQGDIVNVKDGYARNFLFPKNLAIASTPEAVKQAENLKKKRQVVLEKEKEAAIKLAKEISGVSCTIGVETTAEEKLYGSVTKRDILDSLKSEGFIIEERQILLDEPLKSLGIYEVELKLHPEVIAKIKLWIVKK